MLHQFLLQAGKIEYWECFHIIPAALLESPRVFLVPHIELDAECSVYEQTPCFMM